MELGWTHKVEFKMRSTYIIKEKRQLLQVKWKWCSELSKDNFKHKIYKTHNLWEETPLPSLYYIILCAFSWGLHPNVTFPRDSQMWVLKLWFLLFQNFGSSYLFQIKFFSKMWPQHLISLKLSFQQCIAHSNWTSFDPCFQGICGWESNSQFDSCPYFSS